MPCSGSRIRRPLRFAIAISFALAVSAVGLCQQSDTPESANPTHSAPSGLTAVAAIQESLISAIATAEPSVVAIARVRNEVLERQAGGASLPGVLGGPPLRPTDADFIPNEFGAGVVVGRSGLILTNYHILGDPQTSSYFVWTRRRPFPAKILAADSWYDLAVLRVSAKDLVPIEFGDGRAVRKGQVVLALGNPQGIARDGKVSASWGIISNVLRRAPRVPRRSADPLGRETIHQYGTLIQTDAKLNVGFSGGALVDLRGRMVGLTTSFAAGAGFDSSAGFAIPVDDRFRRVVETLKKGQTPEYGFLGVSPEPVGLALRQRGVLGARVVDVFPGTPASKAGIRPGDLVTAIDGHPVFDDDDLIRLVGALPAEAATTLKVVRDFQVSSSPSTNRQRAADIEVVLSKKHLRTLRPQIGQAHAVRSRGIEVDYVTAVADFKEIVDRLDQAGCVVVLFVDPDSSAWEAGLRAGHLVSHVGSVRVSKPDEFHAALDAVEGVVEMRTVTSQGLVELRTVSP